MYKMTGAGYTLERTPRPLEGQLYLVPGISERLDTDFLNGLNGLLRYDPDGSVKINSAAGRNYTVPLPEPIGFYDAVQVAGGGNYDLGIRSNNARHGIVTRYNSPDKTISPPSEDAGLFVSLTTYFENGELVEKENINPVGSYSSVSAKRKIDNTAMAGEALCKEDPEVLTPMYIGRYEYNLADQNGDPQVAILLLVPAGGHRLGDTLLRPLIQIKPDGQSYPGFEQKFRARYKVLSTCFEGLGLSIATAHNHNMNHNQPTPGNAATFQTEDGITLPYLADWDTMTQPSEQDAPYARALDVSVAIRSCASVIYALFESQRIGEETARYAMGMTVIGILHGYLTKNGRDSKEILSPETMVPFIDSDYSNIEIIKYVAGLITI